MRIRRNAARLLGSAYSAAPLLGAAPPPALLPTPPPPQFLAPCSAPKSRGGGSLPTPYSDTGERCELSRSPWDLIVELSLSDPQEEDDLVDRYFVHVATRASWLLSEDTMPAISTETKKPAAAVADSAQLQPEAEDSAHLQSEAEDSAQLQPEAARKPVVSKGKENQVGGQAKEKAKVKQDIPKVWNCKKNDGRRWQCHRKVSRPNSLCHYHLVQKRSYLNPGHASTIEGEAAAAIAAPARAAASKPSTPRAAASKPSTGSKSARRKKRCGRDFDATEGFYYYAGFGYRSKRSCRGSMDDSAPLKQEEEEEEDSIKKEDAKQQEEQHKDASHPSKVEVDTNRIATRGDASSCDEDTAGMIAGVDEVTSDDDYDGEIGFVGSSTNGDPRACNGDIKGRIVPRKRGRKPVKARSLKSLM